MMKRSTDSTIAPPPNQLFSSTNVSWLLDTRKELKTKHPYIFCAKGLSIDDVGVTKGTPYFRRYGRELVLKPAISLNKIDGLAGGGYRRISR